MSIAITNRAINLAENNDFANRSYALKAVHEVGQFSPTAVGVAAVHMGVHRYSGQLAV
jgi:hypothetical protein